MLESKINKLNKNLEEKNEGKQTKKNINEIEKIKEKIKAINQQIESKLSGEDSKTALNDLRKTISKFTKFEKDFMELLETKLLFNKTILDSIQKNLKGLRFDLLNDLGKKISNIPIIGNALHKKFYVFFPNDETMDVITSSSSSSSSNQKVDEVNILDLINKYNNDNNNDNIYLIVDKLLNEIGDINIDDDNFKLVKYLQIIFEINKPNEEDQIELVEEKSDQTDQSKIEEIKEIQKTLYGYLSKLYKNINENNQEELKDDYINIHEKYIYTILITYFIYK